MAKTTANKLSDAAKKLVRQWIVTGLTNGEIRHGLAQRGFPSDLNDSAFSFYRRDPQVQADAEAALNLARQEGLASRIRRIRFVHQRLVEVHHRIEGTTPLPENPDIADAQVPRTKVDNATLKQLTELEVKLLAEMSRLADVPIKRTATIVQKDVAGNVTGSTTLETNMPDPKLRRIATLAQANDAMEAILTLLEAEEKQTQAQDADGLTLAK